LKRTNRQEKKSGDKKTREASKKSKRGGGATQCGAARMDSRCVTE